MKFKVGDTIQYLKSREAFIRQDRCIFQIRKIHSGMYHYTNGFYDSIVQAETHCIKVNHINTKLGQILYAKSN